ncbi:hypothetical protein [Chondromyces apiculatus]|uniref:Lipoprotein n=1 Tax=Chondromyces apiculatus DSM 436 TaxID=1192034 RepID=A0A017TBI9_9BACT|nr:hypothetical protein [Chondromyces apiculatus]EYF06292.1 Hypothetical protein CAP_2170 [Chondromyces apiculatus DSM 436]
MRLVAAREAVLIVASSALAATGCSTPVVDMADANGVVTQGLVLVERSAVEGASAQTNVSAKFMRLPATADADLAERIVGSPFDRPPVGTCLPVGGARGATEEPAPSFSGTGPIELLDVGDVTVRTREAPLALAARAFPDVGDLVFGVFYTSRDTSSELPAPARYTIDSSGSALLERFSFDADAPASPEDVRLGDVDLSDEAVIEEGKSVLLTWRALDTAHVDDRIYVDVIAASGAAVRCGFEDTGRGVLPASALHVRASEGQPTSVTVAVRRVREVPFAAHGIDFGEVRFDLSVLGKARLVSP